MTCTCRTNARCLECIERDGLTRADTQFAHVSDDGDFCWGECEPAAPLTHFTHFPDTPIPLGPIKRKQCTECKTVLVA